MIGEQSLDSTATNENVKKENKWSDRNDLLGYLENIKKNDKNFEQFEKFEIKKIKELSSWKGAEEYFRGKGFDELNVIVIGDENFWKKFYGSNDSKSSYDPMTIILKRDVFEKEGISTENLSFLVHEIAHLLFYDSLGEGLERYMDEYHKKGEYTGSEMEKFAFQMQFDFLKFKGVSKQECIELVRKYMDESFENDEEGKAKEFQQLMVYVENVY